MESGSNKMTEAEYLEDKLRGTGRTTNLIKNAPKDSIFVVATNFLKTRFQKIADSLDRADVKVLSSSQVAEYLRGREGFSDIVFDHYLDIDYNKWQELYSLRGVVRQRYKNVVNSKLDELKGDLRVIEESICPSVNWSLYENLVNKYAPGFKAGLHGRYKAKEKIEELIKAEEESDTLFQKAKKEYESHGVNGYPVDYIERLEKCRPWVLYCPQDNIVFSHAPAKHIIPVLFPSRDEAERCKNMITASLWEIKQWEGPND